MVETPVVSIARGPVEIVRVPEERERIGPSGYLIASM